jgi:poly(hydroxyalkanoate) granule-associated protein
MSNNKRRTRAKPSATGHVDKALAANVKAQAQQIWLAGMGAFSNAQAQGGKVFETLISEGMKLQRKTQSIAEDRISEVAGKMTAMADGVGAKAGQQWDRLETIFEDRVAKALNKMGVPSRADVDALISRIDALSEKVGHRAPAARPAAKAVKQAATRTGKAVKRIAKGVAKGGAVKSALKKATKR